MSDKSHKYIEQMLVYGPFLTLADMGLHYQLFLMKVRSDSTKAIPLAYIANSTKMPLNVLNDSLNHLSVCDLIERKKRNDSISFMYPKQLSKEDMMGLLDKCLVTRQVSEENKPAVLEYINMEEEKRVRAHHFSAVAKPFTFEGEVRESKSAPALVQHYYKTLNQIFGGNYSSYNVIREASALKKVMARTGDTPEQTKKMFEWIIKRAAQHNKFAEVSSMKFYGNQRNNAHRALFSGIPVNSPLAKPVIFSEDEKFGKIRSLYKYYVEDQGLGSNEAIEKIKEAYSGESLDKFLEGLNEKQIHVSERAV